MDLAVLAENQRNILPCVQSLGKAMQEEHDSLRSRIADDHPPELHIGIQLYESDFRFGGLLARLRSARGQNGKTEHNRREPEHVNGSLSGLDQVSVRR